MLIGHLRNNYLKYLRKSKTNLYMEKLQKMIEDSNYQDIILLKNYKKLMRIQMYLHLDLK